MVDWPPKSCGVNSVWIFVAGPEGYAPENYTPFEWRPMQGQPSSVANCGESYRSYQYAGTYTGCYLCEDCARRNGYIW